MTYTQILAAVIAAGILALVIIGFIVLSRWLDRRAYARTESKHRRAVVRDVDIVWGDTTAFDAAFDDDLADFAAETLACGDPDCSQMTHGATLDSLVEAMNLPGLGETAAAALSQAGEPHLPVPVTNGVPAPGLVLAHGGDGEPVLEGVVVHRYDYDTRVIIMGIDDWSRQAHAELADWARQLDAAVAA